MRVKVYLSDDGALEFDDFDSESLLDLRRSLDAGDSWLTFDMDGATVLVNSAHVVRIDAEA